MPLFRRIVQTLKSWAEREDAAPQAPPVPGRARSAASSTEERLPRASTIAQVHPNQGGNNG